MATNGERKNICNKGFNLLKLELLGACLQRKPKLFLKEVISNGERQNGERASSRS